MDLWVAALWGLAGGLCVEALELYGSIKAARRHWSWRHPTPQGLTAYVVSVAIRLGVGAVVAAAAAGGHQVDGTLAAFGLGVSAPLVIERLARTIPLTIGTLDGYDDLPAGRSRVSEVPESAEGLITGRGGEDAS